jgi:hypothetical protein
MAFEPLKGSRCAVPGRKTIDSAGVVSWRVIDFFIGTSGKN